MMLIFDHTIDRYVGEFFTVTAEAYDAGVDELVEGGMDEGEAHAKLLDESEWAEDMEGVALVSTGPLCLHCRRRLPVPQTRFCGVVCEASFYAEVQS